MSGEPDSLTPAEHELEAALGGLTPAAHQIDRDALMFHLGRESAAGARRRWQVTAAAMVVVTLTSWGLSTDRWRSSPGSSPAPLTVAIDQSPEPAARRATKAAAAHRPAEAYLDLRNRVLEGGVDALPVCAVSLRQNVEPVIDWPADQRPPLMWLRARQVMQEGSGS